MQRVKPCLAAKLFVFSRAGAAMSVLAGHAGAHAEIARVLTLRVKDAPSDIGPDCTPLQFPVGAAVVCHVQRWEKAVIVKHWYREANWESGK